MPEQRKDTRTDQQGFDKALGLIELLAQVGQKVSGIPQAMMQTREDVKDIGAATTLPTVQGALSLPSLILGGLAKGAGALHGMPVDFGEARGRFDEAQRSIPVLGDFQNTVDERAAGARRNLGLSQDPSILESIMGMLVPGIGAPGRFGKGVAHAPNIPRPGPTTLRNPMESSALADEITRLRQARRTTTGVGKEGGLQNRAGSETDLQEFLGTAGRGSGGKVEERILEDVMLDNIEEMLRTGELQNTARLTPRDVQGILPAELNPSQSDDFLARSAAAERGEAFSQADEAAARAREFEANPDAAIHPPDDPSEFATSGQGSNLVSAGDASSSELADLAIMHDRGMIDNASLNSQLENLDHNSLAQFIITSRGLGIDETEELARAAYNRRGFGDPEVDIPRAPQGPVVNGSHLPHGFDPHTSPLPEHVNIPSISERLNRTLLELDMNGTPASGMEGTEAFTILEFRRLNDIQNSAQMNESVRTAFREIASTIDEPALTADLANEAQTILNGYLDDLSANVRVDLARDSRRLADEQAAAGVFTSGEARALWRRITERYPDDFSHHELTVDSSLPHLGRSGEDIE